MDQEKLIEQTTWLVDKIREGLATHDKRAVKQLAGAYGSILKHNHKLAREIRHLIPKLTKPEVEDMLDLFEINKEAFYRTGPEVAEHVLEHGDTEVVKDKMKEWHQ